MTISEPNYIHVHRAIQDFKSARQKAVLRELLAHFTGESTELLPFDEVRQKLRAQIGPRKVLKEIPIDSIIGSVNRYQDFTRGFLPGRNVDENRWTYVDAANQGLEGLPPIEAYQIGGAYFVSDGNHRISVAKQSGATEIQGYVTEVHSRVPLTPDIQPEELIRKSEYAQFLEDTNIDRLRPQADLSVTACGGHGRLQEHIAVHRYYMGIEQQHEIQPYEAVVDWYDKVYLPVASIIRERGLLVDFPNRSEADMYLWLAEHRAALEEECRMQIEVGYAAGDLVDRYSHRLDRVFSRIGHRITNAIKPQKRETTPALEAPTPSAGSDDHGQHLFRETLVPINGHQDGWFALQQALTIAQREQSTLHGLYILDQGAVEDAANTQKIQTDFLHRCKDAGVSCDFLVVTGDITRSICDAAVKHDLVVANLSYPPEDAWLARLGSGIPNLIRRCPRPLLLTPQAVSPIHHILLAYDGSLKAREAIYLAAYLTKQWEIPLHVISIGDPSNLEVIQDEVKGYLESHNIGAEYISANKDQNISTILESLEKFDVDLLLIGGYGRNPLIDIVQGSEIDELLRQSHIPILISH